uniref:Uncharacterized protein n=1 Tax=Meloidogyne javanica TaxID=6303 RepID=A0A915NDA5_MELJA
MPYTSLPLVILIPFLWSLSFAIDKDDFSPKSGSKVCVGKICDDSSVSHYYDCCGQLLTGKLLLLQAPDMGYHSDCHRADMYTCFDRSEFNQVTVK